MHPPPQNQQKSVEFDQQGAACVERVLWVQQRVGEYHQRGDMMSQHGAGAFHTVHVEVDPCCIEYHVSDREVSQAPLHLLTVGEHREGR
mmetsp:Transcript_12416/g.18634  ORF Transcript_12416/g.18634 Transcript_12416/m.18634 type:complete len:89 (+) Transcript_12416:289-555(+)